MINVRKKGFTLIEVMVVVAIVAVLVALAVPSFRDATRKSRRGDGMEAILNVHMAQEKWRVSHTTYATLVQLGLSNPYVSPDGYYSLTITGNTYKAYNIVADALGDQANDSCGDFTLAFDAGVITKTADGDNARCWTK